MGDKSLWTRLVPSISIPYDCDAAIALVKTKIYNSKNRHIRLRHNIVRQLIANELITPEFVKSGKNLAFST